LALETEGLRIEDPPTFPTRVEATKAAADNGYRLVRETARGWLHFASTSAPGEIFIAHAATGLWLLSVQHPGVAREFGSNRLEGPALCTVTFPALTELHRALDRVYRLSVSLPQMPLHAFEHETSALPRTTEADRLVVQRVGQDIFRRALIAYWNGTCPLTGITDPALLRASHIVPWAERESDALRLDVYNGLLLSSLWDAAFDCGLISFEPAGTPIVSPKLSPNASAALRIDHNPMLRGLTPQHEALLLRHRDKNRAQLLDEN
jgi:HNH endonuclease